MNIIFIGQSSAAKMYFLLSKRLPQYMPVGKIGFYVSNSLYFNNLVRQYPEINDHVLIKEWEILKKARRTTIDMQCINDYEKRLGDPFLWGPLVCDRRIYLGKNCTLFQDYAARFSHEDMLRILQVALVEIERLFDAVQPDAVLSYCPVTFGDYLCYLFAKARGIPFYNTRTYKILNYVRVSKELYGVSRQLVSSYNDYQSHGGTDSDTWIQKAQSFVQQYSTKDMIYEGAVAAKAKRRRRTQPIIKTLIQLIRDELRYIGSEARYDNHVRGVFYPVVFNTYIKPLKKKYLHLRLRDIYVKPDTIKHLNFVFYPLHTEPEVSLLMFAKPYMNQIETIRYISHNVPVGTKVIVKEHPLSWGKRPLTYYQKLLAIPNVLLVSPTVSTDKIIQSAKMIVTISSSVAFEALARKIPAITLGDPIACPFSILPDTMIQNVTVMNELGTKIKYLLEHFHYDHKALINYIAAAMKISIPVNYYSILLERTGIHGERGDEKKRESEYDRFAQYIARQLTQYETAVVQ